MHPFVRRMATNTLPPEWTWTAWIHLGLLLAVYVVLAGVAVRVVVQLVVEWWQLCAYVARRTRERLEAARWTSSLRLRLRQFDTVSRRRVHGGPR
jgi:hypothetical protein